MELDLVLRSPAATDKPIFVNTNLTPNGQAAALVIRGYPTGSGRGAEGQLSGLPIERSGSSDPRKACMRRVVVTGMGMVTPLGRDLESTWSALLAGKSGVGLISLFDARTFPTRIAAEVKRLPPRRLPRGRRAVGGAFAQQPVCPGCRHDGDEGFRAASSRKPELEPEAVRRLSRIGRGPAGFPAVRQAWSTSRRTTATWTRPSSPGWGSRSCTRSARPSKSRARLPGTWRACSGPEGPNSNCLTACAASSQAIGEAFELIRRGECRRDPFRRHAQHDPSLRRDRIHPADRTLHPQ